MRLLIQWASDAPADWEAVDSADWARLPRRARGGQLGTAPGLLYKLQAREDVWSGYDSIAVSHPTYVAGSDPLMDAAGVLDGEELTRIHGRQDDVRDWPVGSRWERVADYFPMRGRAELGGAIAPITRQTIYAEPDIYPQLAAAYAGNARTVVVEVSELGPAPADPLLGTWVGGRGKVDNPEALAHTAATSARSWREWSDHLPEAERVDGRLKSQRGLGRYVPLKHTRTYFHSDTALTSGTHTGPDNPDFEHALLATTSAAATVNTTVGTGGAVIAVATSPVGEPGSAAWSGVSFTVRHQLDVPSAGVDLTYGCLTQGGEPGHFARVQAGVPPSVELETHEQAEAAFSGGGLHIATFVGNWSAGSTSDRFEILIAGVRTVGHGSQSFSLQLNEADDFADGDWPGAALIAIGVASAASWVAPAAAVVVAASIAVGVAASGVWSAPAASASIPSAAVGVAASGVWAAPSASISVGSVSAQGVAASGVWSAPAASASTGLVAAGQLPAATWSTPAAGVQVGSAAASGVTATAVWVAPAATASAVSGVAGVTATAVWVAPAATVAVPPVSGVGVAAAAAWDAPAATVQPGPVVAGCFNPEADWVTFPATADGVVGVAGVAATSVWTAPAASVLPGSVQTAGGLPAASWAAPSAIPQAGPVSPVGALPSSAWSTAPAAVLVGPVSASGVASTSVWSAADGSVTVGDVTSAAVAGSATWSAPAAAVVSISTAQGGLPVAIWDAPAGAVQAVPSVAPGAAASSSWTTAAASAVLGRVVTFIDTIAHPTATVDTVTHPTGTVDTVTHPTATIDTVAHPIGSVDTEI